MIADPTPPSVFSASARWEGEWICDSEIFRIGGNTLATDNLCTHGHARLCEGFVEGFEIE